MFCRNWFVCVGDSMALDIDKNTEYIKEIDVESTMISSVHTDNYDDPLDPDDSYLFHNVSVDVPAFFSGVYTEFIGDKVMPKSLQERPLIFLFGASGVGKTILAKHLAGTEHLLCRKQDVLDIMLHKVRKRRWHTHVTTIPALILEAPYYLSQRPQILKLLQSLVKLRTKKGLRTFILDSEDRGPIRDLLQIFPPEARATIVLRFPVGRGRYRFLAHECRKRGLPVRWARELSRYEPWTYADVFAQLEERELALHQ